VDPEGAEPVYLGFADALELDAAIVGGNEMARQRISFVTVRLSLSCCFQTQRSARTLSSLPAKAMRHREEREMAFALTPDPHESRGQPPAVRSA